MTPKETDIATVARIKAKIAEIMAQKVVDRHDMAAVTIYRNTLDMIKARSGVS